LFLRRREVRAASLHALRFLNSDTLVFDKDETVDVEIEWECVEPFDNARFYFAVKYSNGDAVGSVISGKISAKKPGHYVSRLSFAFKDLRKGSYYFHAAMIQEDLRDRRILDYPNINIPIEVNETTDTATWQHNIWGHLALDEATIEETRMIEKVET
ncbi:MAG: Wzt carbohydrate-binding domain-containing protein, partial [Oscillospiraceae bacterium]|nr:Wzt carbohydrate-binding domain-containing protein [Oscillospiraceae bacterium]